MDAYRFHCHAVPAAGEVEFSTAQSHHAMHVLRLHAGAQVEIFDGAGRRVAGRIVEARHGIVRAEIAGEVTVQARPQPQVHLAFAVPKGKRLDWLLEKATELGAASLQSVRFERSVAGAEELSESARERWLGHCIAAAKQCGLDFLPEIRQPVSLADYLAGAGKAAGAKLFGDLCDGAQSLPAALRDWHADAAAVLVGPEGGFAPAEREAILSSHYVPVRLGHTTLRIETAALALLAGIHAQR